MRESDFFLYDGESGGEGDLHRNDDTPRALPMMERGGDGVIGISPPNTLRMAIVHDWLPVYAGAERVLGEILSVLPRSDIYSLIDFLSPNEREFLQGKHVRTSFIQGLPFARRAYRYYLPLTPLAIEQFDLTGYDVIVSSSYVVAKGVLTNADQLHISYVHSPIRYAWDLHAQYLREGKFDHGLKGVLARLVLHYMRLYDAGSANRIDVFVANSRHVARRIWKTYRRRAAVIYPPVDTDAFSLYNNKEDFYVTVSRLVPYKRVDLLVETFAGMPDKELIVIGDGPELERIQKMATPNVSVLGFQPFDVVKHYLQRARAFIFAAIEDFGIVSVEAQACGTPVIALGAGGACETVIAGETGLFFPEQSVQALSHAIESFELQRDHFTPQAIRHHAEKFSRQRFQAEFGRLVELEHARFTSSYSR